MKRWFWLPHAASVLLCAGAVAGGWLWLNGFEEKPGIAIRAPHDLPEQGLPVFAQFTVTQRINLDESLEAVRLEVPVYWPKESEWLRVDLLHEGQLIQRWRVRPPAEDKIVETQLPLVAPLLLSGQIELLLSGDHINHENQHRAPRIYIESADYVFPNGNYRIAENEKAGDVAMVFNVRRLRHVVLAERWRRERVEIITNGLKVVMALILVAGLPYVVVSQAFLARRSKKRPGGGYTA